MLVPARCFIMLCTRRTENECIARNLLGDRVFRLDYFAEVQPGDFGFLLNVSKDQLIGIFEATSKPQLDIEPEAWGGEFRTQIQVSPKGELIRLKDAMLVLSNAAIQLIPLPSGMLVPATPVHGREVTANLLNCFEGSPLNGKP